MSADFQAWLLTDELVPMEFVGTSDGFPAYGRELIDRVCNDDRVWFERHPTAQVRQRLLVPGEFGPDTYLYASPGNALMVQVVRLESGARVRRPYAIVP